MIDATVLRRTFGSGTSRVEAVKGLDLHVGPGELVALLGPNGAGKSTTLRMLTTLLPPSSGTASVAGADIVANPAEVRARIGYIGQKNGAGHNYRVRDELLMQGRFYGLDRATATREGQRLLEVLDLKELASRKVSTLSGGQQRRLDIALGLIHAPALLFLDEPTTGMDPQNRAHLWEHIQGLREQYGTTIVLTTHYLDEADAMAERVVIIDHGEIIADDTPQALKDDLAGDRLQVTVASHDLAVALDRAAEIDQRLEIDQGVGIRHDAERRAVEPHTVEPHTVEHHDAGDGESDVVIRLRGASRRLPAFLSDLDRHGVQVLAASADHPTLDDVFLTLTGRSLRDGADAA
ncbi:MAG: ATP-binding cassette domain-containing protein [Dermatophilaceae bacterium]